MISTKQKLSLGSFINEDDFISISEFMNHPQFKNPVDSNDRKRVIRNTLETMYSKAKNPNETRGRPSKKTLGFLEVASSKKSKDFLANEPKKKQPNTQVEEETKSKDI